MDGFLIIGLICLIGGFLFLGWHGNSAFEALILAGAQRREGTMFEKPEYLSLATIGNHGYENKLCAKLTAEGVYLKLKGDPTVLLLPLHLLTPTDAKWTYPLEFGAEPKTIKLNLDNAVTAAHVRNAKTKANNAMEGDR